MKLWLICVLAASCLVLLIVKSPAHDAGQWEMQDPEIRGWFQSLRQPDNPGSSCCGLADAYYADRIEVIDGRTYAIITDTRDDVPLMRPHVDVGTRIEIPPHKFGPGKWGNPTGHTVLFLSYGRQVYCFVQATGT